MAYNNYFPVGYQPYVPYQPQNVQNYGNMPGTGANVPPVQNQPQNGFNWIQGGENTAKAYPVAPNTTVQLWDSESNTIYIKSADMNGMPSMKILDYTVRDSQTPTNAVAKPDYITRAEFEKAIKELRGEKHESDLSAVWKDE